MENAVALLPETASLQLVLTTPLELHLSGHTEDNEISCFIT